MNQRVFGMPVARVWPLYVEKLARKGRTEEELVEVTRWLTGYTEPELRARLDDGTTFEQFFAECRLNPNASLITGVICGMRVEQIEDPLMQRIRYLDKLVDELSHGKAMAKVLRTPAPAPAAS